MKVNKCSRFSFVILHYLAYEMTQECVRSILQNVDGEYSIVIVDNGSHNGSGEKLQEIYSLNNKIHVLIQKDNLGFAKGNNIGIVYARETLESEYICVMNNDVLISQKDFIFQCINAYQKKNCAVLGPEIIRKDGSIQPFYGKLRSRQFYLRVKWQLKLEMLLLYFKIDLRYLVNKLNEYRSRKSEMIGVENVISGEDYVLHGCCWIFTPDFLKVLSGLDDRTFLYREEELLSILLKKNGLHSRYVPDIKVIHYEDVATNCIQKRSVDKRKFMLQNEIKSLSIVIEELG